MKTLLVFFLTMLMVGGKAAADVKFDIKSSGVRTCSTSFAISKLTKRGWKSGSYMRVVRGSQIEWRLSSEELGQPTAILLKAKSIASNTVELNRSSGVACRTGLAAFVGDKKLMPHRSIVKKSEYNDQLKSPNNGQGESGFENLSEFHIGFRSARHKSTRRFFEPKRYCRTTAERRNVFSFSDNDQRLALNAAERGRPVARPAGKFSSGFQASIIIAPQRDYPKSPCAFVEFELRNNGKLTGIVFSKKALQ
ncbi:MAG: hypothetical protein AAF141_00120 [Pseudomonadota bacterium]